MALNRDIQLSTTETAEDTGTPQNRERALDLAQELCRRVLCGERLRSGGEVRSTT